MRFCFVPRGNWLCRSAGSPDVRDSAASSAGSSAASSPSRRLDRSPSPPPAREVRILVACSTARCDQSLCCPPVNHRQVPAAQLAPAQPAQACLPPQSLSAAAAYLIEQGCCTQAAAPDSLSPATDTAGLLGQQSASTPGAFSAPAFSLPAPSFGQVLRCTCSCCRHVAKSALPMCCFPRLLL